MNPADMNFGDARRRRIYEYVEREGSVRPETVRQNVLVHAESSSKPARSGAAYDPETTMKPAEFRHHLSILKRDGYLKERDGMLHVGFHPEEEVTEVDTGEVTAAIRPARQQDITGIIGVIRTVAAGGNHIVAKRLAEDLDRTDVLLRHNESETRTFFVATVDEDAVGWLHVAAPGLPEMRHTAELTVGVLDEYRGAGIGRALMRRGLNWAREQGYQKVYQGTPASNTGAIEFLKHNGWEQEAIREGQYLINGALEDEVLLAVWPEAE
jgi:GNAT superfamily N-acetyltransferase